MKKTSFRVVLAGVAVTLLVIAGAMAIQDYVDRKYAGGEEETGAGTRDMLAAEAEAEMTVAGDFRKLLSPELLAKLESFGRTFSNESMPGVPRVFSDSVAMPLQLPGLSEVIDRYAREHDADKRRAIAAEMVKICKGKEKEARWQIYEQILLNPVVTRMVALGLAEQKPAGANGRTIGELNPWLMDYILKANGALDDRTSPGIMIFLVTRGGELEVTKEQMETGIKIVCLLEKLKDFGFGVWSVKDGYYALVPEGDIAFQRVEKNSLKDELPFLAMGYVPKGTGKPAFLVGFNVTGKEWAELAPSKPKPEVRPEAKEKEKVKVIRDTKIQYRDRWKTEYRDRIKEVKVPVLVPGKTETIYLPGDTKIIEDEKIIYLPCPVPEDGEGRKDPKQDPAEQGNAPIGGGPNLPGDGDGGYDRTPDVPPPSEKDPVVTVPNDPLPGGEDQPKDPENPTPPPSEEPGYGLDPTPTPPIKPEEPEKPDDPPFEGPIVDP